MPLHGSKGRQEMAPLSSALDALLLEVLQKCPRPWASKASSLNYD